MPVILTPDAFGMWLDSANVDAKTAAALIAPAQDDLFEAYEIAPLVNRVANDGPELQAPYTAPAVAEAKPARKPKKNELEKNKLTKSEPEKDDKQTSLF